MKQSPETFRHKNSLEQADMRFKIKKYDPIFSHQVSIKSESPRSIEDSPRKIARGGPKNNITYEALEFCTQNELIVKENMKILTKKDPIYSYQKLDQDIRKPLEDTISRIKTKRIIEINNRWKSKDMIPNEEFEEILK